VFSAFETLKLHRNCASIHIVERFGRRSAMGSSGPAGAQVSNVPQKRKANMAEQSGVVLEVFSDYA
jgi:hypothetical protein